MFTENAFCDKIKEKTEFKMVKEYFGTLDGEKIYKYTLKNKNASISVINFGAILQDFCAFGKSVVGGFDCLESYLKDDSHQGAVIGRVANRIGGASFEVDGKVYTLPKNDGENCLHGGCGFDRRIWTVTEANDERIVLEYTSRDLEEGFPSEVYVQVCYTLLKCGFAIEYLAIPCGKTPISLTHHAYFNLDGFGGNIEKQRVAVYANTYTEVGDDLIPTGKRPSVTGTVFDLRELTKIEDRLSCDFLGYDHNFNLSGGKIYNIMDKNVRLAATVENEDTRLSVFTDQPALQLYIGNFLGSGPNFSGNIKQVYHGAMCLEAQTEPNSVKQGKNFYKNGEKYTQFTLYTVEKI